MKSQANYCLLAGNYICPIAFPQEYDYLLDEANRDYTQKLKIIDSTAAG